MLRKAQLNQIKHLTIASMKARYRKTFAGFIWVIINPIVLYGAQSLAFKKFLRLEIPNFFTFLLSGLLPWILIVQTLLMTTPILVSQGHLLKSLKAHPIVLISSQILDNFINFVFAFTLLFIPICLTEEINFWGLLFLPIATLILLVGLISLSTLLSLLNVFFRDMAFMINFVVSFMFFLTPIFYPIDYVPDYLRWIVHINPFYALINPIRSTLYQFDLENVLKAFMTGSAWSVGILLLSLFYWKKRKERIFYHV